MNRDDHRFQLESVEIRWIQVQIQIEAAAPEIAQPRNPQTAEGIVVLEAEQDKYGGFVWFLHVFTMFYMAFLWILPAENGDFP